jgi:hypothetical protein
VRALRAAIAEHREPELPFDICLHGPAELAAEFADAGVTWFMESLLPDEPLAEVRRVIEQGPARVAGFS